ncbi:unnamed protein product [Allacma fusca]|uniref:procollagen-proline 4-dioxygenase n=1 Tax=Allacma fusca TaxID=39272 RepID=A0A8J2KZG6_9HEXA|nr:unnamed protein product [Allacma fusca]
MEMAELEENTTSVTTSTDNGEAEDILPSPSPNDTKNDDEAKTLIVPEEVKQDLSEINMHKADEPTTTPETEKLPIKANSWLKVYAQHQLWKDLLLSLTIACCYYIFQTRLGILNYMPGVPASFKLTNQLREPASTHYLIPSSPFDLQLLAQQEQIGYTAIKNCQNKLMNPISAHNYTGGYYLAITNQYLLDYETSSHPIFKKNFTLGPESVAGNPMASFRMLDRFVSLLPLLHTKQYPCDEFKTFGVKMIRIIRWPNEKDVEENIIRILRLQHVYNFKTNDVAQGILANISTEITISPWQSYQFGLIALKHMKYYLAVQWLEHAMNGNGSTRRGTSFYRQVQKTLNEAIIKHDSTWNQSIALTTQYHFSERLVPPGTPKNQDLTKTYKVSETNRNFLVHVYRNELEHFFSFEINYWATCSGEDLRPLWMTSNLFCWLESKNHPTWTIRPLKMELLSLEPDIIQVYDILNDSLIEATLAQTRPNMVSSKVVDRYDPKLSQISTTRTSRQSWLSDWYDPQFSYFSKTVERITGLVATTQTSSEKLQVLSYSFGGHYYPHVDALRNNLTYGLENGDRILTFMYYLSDVQAGGYTSFTAVGVAARPVKGSAVFWFNLFTNGETDEPISQHGGCPVIFGRKTAANKWVRLMDQFQVRKCSAFDKDTEILHRAKINGYVRVDTNIA